MMIEFEQNGSTLPNIRFNLFFTPIMPLFTGEPFSHLVVAALVFGAFTNTAFYFAGFTGSFPVFLYAYWKNIFFMLFAYGAMK